MDTSQQNLAYGTEKKHKYTVMGKEVDANTYQELHTMWNLQDYGVPLKSIVTEIQSRLYPDTKAQEEALANKETDLIQKMTAYKDIGATDLYNQVKDELYKLKRVNPVSNTNTMSDFMKAPDETAYKLAQQVGFDPNLPNNYLDYKNFDPGLNDYGAAMKDKISPVPILSTLQSLIGGNSYGNWRNQQYIDKAGGQANYDKLEAYRKLMEDPKYKAYLQSNFGR